MNTTIHKYTLKSDVNKIQIPEGGIVIDSQLQHGEPVMWVQVDPTKEKVTRSFMFIPTGGNVTDKMVYIKTVQFHGGNLVFHLYEIIN